MYKKSNLKDIKGKIGELFDTLFSNINKINNLKNTIYTKNYNPNYKKNYFKKCFKAFILEKKNEFNLTSVRHEEFKSTYDQLMSIFIPFLLLVSFPVSIATIQKGFSLFKIIPSGLAIIFSIFFLIFLFNSLSIRKYFNNENLEIEKNIKNATEVDMKKNFCENGLEYEKETFNDVEFLNEKQLTYFLLFIKDNLTLDEINEILETNNIEMIEEPYAIYKLLLKIKKNEEDKIKNNNRVTLEMEESRERTKKIINKVEIGENLKINKNRK